MEMPKPSDRHRKLEALAGTWIGEETMFPSPWDPKGGTAVGRTHARMDLDGFFLLSDYTQERDGQVGYRGHGVFGWNPKAQRYSMHWFDGMGGIPPEAAHGTWEGDTLSFQHSTAMGHSRYTWILDGKDRQRFRLENSPDGERWATFLEATYRRA